MGTSDCELRKAEEMCMISEAMGVGVGVACAHEEVVSKVSEHSK
jgi:hypothetical protein